MNPKITTLIDKYDTNELVRNQIAAILKLEISHQAELAQAADKNAEDFLFDVYIERSRPWEVRSDTDGGVEIGKFPLVNILFDNDIFDANGGSGVVEKQSVKGTFYIDCYGHKNRRRGKSTDENIMSDELSSRESDRIARLARNIIMAGDYAYLDLRTVVNKRYVTRREKFLPDIKFEGAENVIGTRITLVVDYYEYSPQNSGVDLLSLVNQIAVNENGLVTMDQDFDLTEVE